MKPPTFFGLGIGTAALLLAFGPGCTKEQVAGPAQQQQKATTSEVPPAAVTPLPPRSDCSPCYPDVCLKVGVGDYDCAGGSGDGPNYVRGPVRVVGCDPFGLDRDGEGCGCE